jgi:hypothetical protein
MIRTVADPVARTPPVISEVIDAELNARLAAQRKQSDQNAAWLQAHADEVYSHRGKYFCIAAQELFVSDTVAGAVTAARHKHPDDLGYLFRYIPLEQLPRV